VRPGDLFARFVFDIQFLLNLRDFLAGIGAVCVQRLPGISLAHKLFQNDAIVRAGWCHSIVGDQGCARIRFDMIFIAKKTHSLLLQLTRIRILAAAFAFIPIDWNLS
jgi:hypothetical protein